MLKLEFLSFNFQVYLLSSVWFFFVLLKVDLWLYNPVLNSVSDVPKYKSGVGCHHWLQL